MPLATAALLATLAFQTNPNPIDRAIAYLGGPEVIATVQQFRVVYLGTQDTVAAFQGRSVSTAEPKRLQETLIMDVPAHRAAVRAESVQSNDTPALWRRGAFENAGYSLNLKSGRQFNVSSASANETWDGYVWSIPHLALAHLRDTHAALSPAGIATLPNRVFERYSTPTPGGPLTILFDHSTGALAGYEHAMHQMTGPNLYRYVFKPYRNTPGFGKFPSGYTVWFGPAVSRDLDVLDARFSNVHDDPWLRDLPSDTRPGSSVARVPPRDLQQIAPGIFFLRNVGGYNTLFADQGDCVTVIDALWSIPSNNILPSTQPHPDLAQQVLETIHSTLPGKKVCRAIPTHHHSDHFGGVSTYARNGAAIVTSPANVELARRLGAARIETVHDKLTIGSGSNRIEVYLIKGDLHTGEMLFAYFPEHRLVFQGDIADYVLSAKLFLRFVDERALRIDRIYSVHSANPFALRGLEDDEPGN